MRALVLVDLQNDFVPGGALPVPEGHEVVHVVNRIVEQFEIVVASKDWHPPDHGSFAPNHPGRQPGEVIDLNGLPQILWPPHCIQNTPGAEFVAALQTTRIEQVFYKATDPGIDSYSTFFDNGHRRSTGMHDYLQERGVKEVYLAGLATDYCVKFSALDAQSLGYRTFLIEDACRGIDLKPGDVEAALEEKRRAGVVLTTSAAIG